jgi:hypothetical protein
MPLLDADQRLPMSTLICLGEDESAEVIGSGFRVQGSKVIIT